MVGDAKDYFDQGEELYRTGQLNEALRAYDRAIELNPKYPAPWNGKGNAYEALGRYEDALAAFDRAIALDEQPATPWCNKGVIYGNLGRYEEALAAFDRAIAHDDQFADPWINKGVVYEALGRHEDALRAFERSIELDPKRPAPWNGKGNAYEALGRYEDALQAYEQSIALDPKHPGLWHGKGNVLDNLGRYEDALQAYEQSIALDPEFAYPWHGKGNVYYDLGHYEDALEAYDHSITLSPRRPAPWTGKGNALQKMGRYEEALRAHDRAIDLDPQNYAPWTGKGNVYNNLGRYEDALQAFEQSIELDPKHPAPWTGKGNVYNNLGRYGSASRAYRRSYKLFRRHPDQPSVANLLLHFWEHGPSPFFLQRLFREDPQLETYLTFARLREETAQRCAGVNALVTYLEVGASDLDDLGRRKLLGLVHHYMGDPVVAEKWFSKADDLEAGEEDLAVQYYLIQARDGYVASVESMLDFIVEIARDCWNDRPEDLSDEAINIYYAGLVLLRNADRGHQADRQLALACFEAAAEAFLPACYMAAQVADLLDKEKRRDEWIRSILDEEARLTEGERPTYGFLRGVHPQDIALDQEDWDQPFWKYAHYQEITQAVHLVYTWLNETYGDEPLPEKWQFIDFRLPPEQPHAFEVWQFMDQSKQTLREVAEQVREEELNAEQRELRTVFGEDPLLVDVEDAGLEDMSVRVARRLEELSHEELHTRSYDRLILYLLRRQRLSDEDALLLLIYFLLRRALSRSSEESLAEKTVETIVSTGFGLYVESLTQGIGAVPGGSITVGTAGFMKLLLEMAKAHRRAWTQHDVPVFGEFKRGFYRYMNDERERLGVHFERTYPLGELDEE